MTTRESDIAAQVAGAAHQVGRQWHRRRFLQVTLGLGAAPELSALLAGSDATAAEVRAPAPGAGPAPHRRSADSPMQEAIQTCLDCSRICMDTVFLHLNRGDANLSVDQFRMLLNCAEMCRTSASFMQRGSPLHGRVCSVCAEVCEACADSCAQADGLDDCIEMCRRCAKSCRSMA